LVGDDRGGAPKGEDVEKAVDLRAERGGGVARGLAPAYRAVSSPGALLGELAPRTHGRWLEDWLTGPGEVSLGLFLRDRLRDHLRDLRRRADRRGALLGGAVPGEALVETETGARGAILASEPPSPERALEAREIHRDLATQGDAELIGLRAAGYEHAEIARRTGLSRQTVGRRLGVILGVLGALAAAGVVLLASRPETVVQIGPDPTAGGAGDLTPTPPDAGVELDAPEPLSDSQEHLDHAMQERHDLEPRTVPPDLDDSSIEEAPADGDAPAVLRIPPQLAPAPSASVPTSPEASGPEFQSARAERLRAALALCRREPGGSVRIELRPGELEDVGVDRFDRACATTAVRRELQRGRPDVGQSFRFSVDADRAVRAAAGAPSGGSPDPLLAEADACGDDDACVVRVLSERAASPRQLARLFEAQSSLRSTREACVTLSRLLQRFPASNEATRLRPRHRECVTHIDDLIAAPRP